MGDNKTINWINWIKCICIIFVYLNHSEIYAGDYLCIRPVYRPFFVNAFFFVSGYLLFKKQLATTAINERARNWIAKNGLGMIMLKNIFFKLAVPTILFSAIMFIPKVVLRGKGISVNLFIHDTLLGGSIWFTSALAIAELLLIVPLLFRIKNVWIYVVYSSALTFLSYILYSYNVTLNGDPTIPWYYKSGMSATIIMSLGGVYWKYEEFIDKFLSRKKILLFLPMVILLLIYYYINNSTINVNINLDSIGICSLLIICTCIYIVIRICKILPQCGLVDFWGRNTIGLYLFCGGIPNLFATILQQINIPHVVVLPITFILSIATALLSVIIINKYMPYLYDLRLINANKQIK